MVIEVLFFGPAKDAVGSERVAVEVGERATVADVRARLAGRSEAMRRLLATARLARNRSFARDEEPVDAGDEIAVIPPVSGG